MYVYFLWDMLLWIGSGFFGLILVLLIWFGRFDSNFEIVNMSKVFFSEFNVFNLGYKDGYKFIVF